MERIDQDSMQSVSPETVITVGEYAYRILQEQYHSIVKQEKKVLADQHPEHLHRMRVATRRLRTALQVFQGAIAIPNAANANRVANLARTLGQLRDLDVQIADLDTVYRPLLLQSDHLDGEVESLDQTIAILTKKRKRAFATVKDTLQRSRYRKLKAAYEDWLIQPSHTALASLPLLVVLPELLSPLLANLLLHPGWLVPANYTAIEDGETLHDLRKAFKHVRYEAEFFLEFYGEDFQAWVDQIKALQEQLGKLQDSHVLLNLLQEHLPKHATMPTLEAHIHQNQAEALKEWDALRCQYLDPEFRRRLHQMLLAPKAIAPELILSAKNP